MRRVLEEQASTPDEAVRLILERLGVAEEEVAIDILDQGSDSPLCPRPARVRVTHDTSPRVIQPDPGPRVTRDPSTQSTPGPSMRSTPGPSTQPTPGPSMRSTSGPSEPASDDADVRGARYASVPAADDSSQRLTAGSNERPTHDPPAPEIGEIRVVVGEILRRMHIDAKLDILQSNGKIFVTIDSDAGGLLIGKGGKNIDALQHIVNRIVNRGNHDRATVVLDTEDYRRRRRETLEDLAWRAADRAHATGRTIALGEMNPHDRRIVHLTLREERGIETYSEGSGFLKEIFVEPTAPPPRRGPRY
jgi:spoIIIJ-associated protein